MFYFLVFSLNLLVIFTTHVSVNGLDNGLARTPPMGWMTWAKFGCHVDCVKEPNGCISDKLIRSMASVMVTEGYLDAGYEYVNIDDCWSEMERDPVTQALVPNATRFPDGIENLSSFVHSLGLRFGIYGDIGTKTCEGYPGFWIGNGSASDYFLLDTETFASWGVDSIKVDGCYQDIDLFDRIYPRFGQALNFTGRPILYSCSWPAYQVYVQREPDYASIAKSCNLWRNYNDIELSFESVLSIIEFFAQNQADFVRYQSPGAWFDPDMIIVGNEELTLGQARVQMAIWSILSAPLLMSNDLRTIKPEFKQLLLNRKVIAVDQDPMGIMGERVFNASDLQIWVKPIEPVVKGKPSFAVALVNTGVADTFSFKLSDILTGKDSATSYSIDDLFGDEPLNSPIELSSNLTLKVGGKGDARMVKLIPRDGLFFETLTNNDLS